ncbi:P-loop containing nucleoside triphosphate hydrolase protein [Syncephalastrum racemosum]|uniref:P-loop containing nucleoside triphosphate hydrolase protein n=1 Tax=Syncephalastrum racemosum TaxID=13706 RepID=A0A1X2H7N7_SYNRA|nr:P-loop containing nucleoside triphosphate hydrolase protein [Syncephalastrum racemosum]
MLWAILFIFSFLATFCVAVLPRPTRTLRLQPFERSTSPTTPTSSSSSTGSNDSLHPSMRLHRASSSSGRPATPPSTPLPSSSMSDANFLMPSPSSTTDSKPIEENVRVLVRVRPLSDKEKDNRRASACCWETGPCTIRLSNWASTARTPEPFYFDAVVTSPNTDQVYSSCISDVVKSAMRGFNGTVFAYGQTASGKTYVSI